MFILGNWLSIHLSGYSKVGVFWKPWSSNSIRPGKKKKTFIHNSCKRYVCDTLCIPEALLLFILLNKFEYECFLRVWFLLCKVNSKFGWLLFCDTFHHGFENFLQIMLLPPFVGERWDEGYAFLLIPSSWNFSSENSKCRKGLRNGALTITREAVSGKRSTHKFFLVNYEAYNQALSVDCAIKSS